MPFANTNPTVRISVIIPTHNRLRSLKIAIESVLAQTCPVHEIIVVDDGSVDGTAEWLEQQSAPLRYLVQSNHGVSHARNRGIEQARGDWIALLDSDDHWHKDKLIRQMQSLARQPEYRLCHCNEIWIRNGKRINQKQTHRKQGGYIFEQCLALCAISPSAAVIHNSLFTELGMFDESLPACEDYDLWLRITSREPVVFVDEALLTKTGGHDDQLSSRYPVMDRFRLQSLAKIIRSARLDEQSMNQATLMFEKKMHIVRNGARRRGNEQLLQSLDGDIYDLSTDAR